MNGERVPGEPLRRSVADLVADANRVAPPIGLSEALALHESGRAVFVDLREPKEIEREGAIPHAYRAPRGMLEFWVDPSSPYHRPALDDGRPLVLYCASAWRSALAAAASGFSGAEIEQAIVSALYTAHAEQKPLDMPLLLQEIHGTRPLSVIMAEQVTALRAWARERTVPAD